MLDTRFALRRAASTDEAVFDPFFGIPASNPRHAGPAPGGIHIWTFDVATLDLRTVEICRAVLSADEIERAERFRSSGDRNRFESGRGLMRRILSHYTGQSPSGISFRLGPHGKPFLQDSGLLLNWSHSGSLWTLAIAGSGEVGVDIEAEANATDWAGPASIAFSTDEIAHVLHAGDEDGRRRRFLDVWTRKEALLKASGKGLHDEIRTISVIGAGGQPAARLDLGLEGLWWLTGFQVAASTAGALVTRFEPRDIRVFDGRALVDPACDQATPSAAGENCLSSVRLESLP